MTGKLATIMNFHSYSDELSAGGQPSPEQLRNLKEEGFEAIINISPASTRNYLSEEAGMAESLGLEYVHFPVDCSNLKEFHFTTFKGIMRGLQGKRTFVHCGGNIKSSNLIHMYNVLERGMNEADSVKELKKIQEPESKWFDYFKSFGMMGLS